LDVKGKVLAAGGLQAWPLQEEARGCPVPDTATSSCLWKGPITGHS